MKTLVPSAPVNVRALVALCLLLSAKPIRAAQPYIDVSSFSGGWSSSYKDQPVSDEYFEDIYHLNWGDHIGGNDELFRYNPPFTGSCDYVTRAVWSPGDSYWPNGWAVRTRLCDGQQEPGFEVGPPSVPWGKTSLLYTWTENQPGWTATWKRTRDNDTHLELHTGTVSQFILLAATADRIDWTTYGPYYNYEETISSVPFADITLLGEQLNADLQVFTIVDNNVIEDVTPTVNAPNYYFYVGIGSHKHVYFQRAYHPRFLDFGDPPPLEELQVLHNSGSLLLGTDSDTKIPDSDVPYSDEPSSTYRNDDVPLYVEFHLSDGPFTYVPNHGYYPAFPANFQGDEFFDLSNDDSVAALINWSGVNIKQVRSVVYQGQSAKGVTLRPSNPASIILAGSADNLTVVHEWGHACGLLHRGLPENPGQSEAALMANPASGGKVNRFERNSMLAY